MTLTKSSRRLTLPGRKRLRDLLRRLASLAGWPSLLAHSEPTGGWELQVEFAGPRRMAGWNRAFLNHAGATDVLAFDYTAAARTPPQWETGGKAGCGLRVAGCGPEGEAEDKFQIPNFKFPDPAEPALAGVLIVCPAVAAKACRRYGTTPEDELLLYLVHGMLHLAGEDDLNPRAKRRMRRREAQILAALRAENLAAAGFFRLA